MGCVFRVCLRGLVLCCYVLLFPLLAGFVCCYLLFVCGWFVVLKLVCDCLFPVFGFGCIIVLWGYY